MLRSFGVPTPLRPTPDELYHFREMKAHIEFRDFIGALDRGMPDDPNDFELQHAIIDQIESSFSSTMRQKNRRGLVRGFSAAGVDSFLALVGIPLPLATAVSLGKNAVLTEESESNSIVRWRTFFSTWSK